MTWLSDSALLLQQAVEYFSSPGFKRLMTAMAERYRSLGRIGGSIKLEQLVAEEQQALSGVLGKDLQSHDAVNVKLSEFQKALDQTRFAGLNMVEVLQGVAGAKLRPVGEERREFAAEQNHFFASLRADLTHPRAQAWLSGVEQQVASARALYTAYREDRLQLRVDLEEVLTALSNLPVDAGVVKRLPVWAADVTGDPHAFDVETTKGRYLLSALKFFREQADDDMEECGGADSPAFLLETVGIVRDDILNFVTCYGLYAEDSNGPLNSWRAAVAEGAVLNVPVREAAKLRKVTPAHDHCLVFAVENSGVFSYLMDNLPHLAPPLICTHGQPKLASYLVFDKLVESGATIYYSGDYDPEGLLIAQRLSDRYPGQVRPWRFGLDDYKGAVSQIAVSAKRLGQLLRVTSPDLLEVKEQLMSDGRAGYQEKILPSLLQDLQQFSGTK